VSIIARRFGALFAAVRRFGKYCPVAKHMVRAPAWLGPLSTAEQALWDAFPHGETVDLRCGDPAADDVAVADGWPDSRRIRAEVIAALLLGAVPVDPGRLASVRVRGAWVTGDLDLSDCEVRHPLSVTGSRVGVVRASNASCRSVSLRGCRVDGFYMLSSWLSGNLDLRGSRMIDPVPDEERMSLEGTDISGTAFLSRSEIHGGVVLVNTKIGQRLMLYRCDIRNGTGVAIQGRRLATGNQVYAEYLRCVGRIDLADARLGGRLVLDGALLDNPVGDALAARQLTVDGELSMRPAPEGPFTSRGRIYMAGARIEGTLGMEYARLGDFDARGITVRRSLRLAAAEARNIVLAGAVIGDQLELSGARLDGVFSGAGLSVAGEARLETYLTDDGSRRPFHGLDSVHFDGAVIGGNLRAHGARLDGEPALNLSGAQVTHGIHLKDGLTTSGEVRLTGARIGGHLNLRGMTSPDGLLTLYNATAAEAVDDGLTAWPGRLNLDGFGYQNLSPYRPARDWLELLARQAGGYRPRPYEQLAAWYRRLGHDDEARAVLLARQRARRRGYPAWRRVPGYLADALAGYGYLPSRALAWALCLLVSGSAYFARFPPTPLRPAEHSVFNPVLYTAGQLIPLVQFGTADTWQPHGPGLFISAALTILGWALSIAIAAGATRALSRS
jgi:hypothetical protein